MAVTNLAALRSGVNENVLVTPGFETVAGFEALQRMAHIFHESNIVPERFSAYARNTNPNVTFGNVVIALDMALRMRANPLMVFQNLYVVQGNPSWSSQFLFATFNQSGKYSALRYEFEGKPGTDAWGCKAVATELATKFSPELRINAIVPGFLLTNQNRTLLTNPDGSYTDRAKAIIAHTPCGRFAEPEELFGTIHYLISDASSFVTGALSVVDGGFDVFSI